MTVTLNRGKICLFEYMKNILNHSGFSYNWLEKTTYNTKWLKAKIGFTLTDQFKQNWQITFQSLPNALDYKIYYHKDELKLENYLLLLSKEMPLGFAFVITIFTRKWTLRRYLEMIGSVINTGFLKKRNSVVL